MVGRVCGRGFCGYDFLNGVLLGYVGVNSDCRMDISWEISIGPRLGDLEWDLVRKSEWV